MPPNDHDVAADATLHSSGYAERRSVRCDYDANGHVLKLHGHVTHHYLRQLSQECVRRIECVGSIVNRIRVESKHSFTTRMIMLRLPTARRLFSFIVLCASFSAIAQEVSAQEVSVSEDSRDDRDIPQQLAEKRLELATHDLKMAIAANRRIPNLHSKLTIMRLEKQATNARSLLEQARLGDQAKRHAVHLRSVQDDLDLARQQLSWAKKVEDNQPGSIEPGAMKRLELAVELAELASARAKSPEITADPFIHLQWQIDRMQSEILSLHIEMERLRRSG